MSVSLQVHRTIKRAEIMALYMVFMKLCWPAEMFSDHRRVVRAFNKGEVNCFTASHKDAELWVQVWRKIKEFIDESGLVCGTGRWLGLMNMPMS